MLGRSATGSKSPRNFSLGQALALFVEIRVRVLMFLLELLKRFAGSPAIERYVASALVEIADEFSSTVPGTLAKELSPVSVRSVDFLERDNAFRFDVEFPERDERRIVHHSAILASRAGRLSSGT